MAEFFLSDAEWLEYENTINSFMNDDSANQVVTWIRSVRALNSDGNDDNILTEEVALKGLIQYNDFRSWPINIDTITGQIDKESLLLLLNDKYLKDNNFLNTHGQFDFEPVLDSFKLQGVTYRAKGDSQTAQVKNKTLIHFVILKRDKLTTPQTRY